MIRNPRLAFLVPALGLVAAAHAQSHSLEAFQGLYVGDGSGAFTQTDGNFAQTTAADPFTVSRSFTGMDSQGNAQTMNVSGSAYSSSTYGTVHMYGAGTVTNPYYNAANESVLDSSGDFDPNGSPDLIGLHGNAGWSDSVTYTGFQGTGYLVRYQFVLEGENVQGDTEAGLNFSTSAANAPSYNPRTTRDHELWSTPDYQLTWGTPFDIDVDFYAGLTTYTSQRPEGQTIVGIADYADTLNLAGIVITDPTGKVVNGWKVSSDSKFQYPTQAVPEPTSLAAMAAGLVALGLRRRTKRRS